MNMYSEQIDRIKTGHVDSIQVQRDKDLIEHINTLPEKDSLWRIITTALLNTKEYAWILSRLDWKDDKYKFDISVLLDDDSFIECLSRKCNRHGIWKTITSRVRTQYYDPKWFVNEKIEFDSWALDILRVPLEYIETHMIFILKESNILLCRKYRIQERPDLTQDFVKRRINLISWYRSDKSPPIYVWQYQDLINSQLCRCDLTISVMSPIGTTRIEVPSYFPLHSLSDLIETPDETKQVYFLVGDENALDRNMLFSELETQSVFVLFKT